ncbi:MAG TPA: cell division topological specificity factor MinE [Peptococcaceae bacterium]|jgi:cell division topological specificity factor|nr:cell division topological specificity factor MinE [Clostridia bacterium]HOB82237.1 cell division topological specificity factor MinE [Peptococcaceae bacterium]HPZ70966.1 cell division topological specificity factor MinE [Peptococcaceae bacterium]HQD54138.1 cell division topological specificity factor MinE [Peptococcaceae bacterium]
MDFLERLFGRRKPTSKIIAKERLRLVLVHDRASISPQVLDSLKEDMLDVISNYMEIDRRGTEVTLNSDKESVALIANIPVIGVVGRNKRGVRI